MIYGHAMSFDSDLLFSPLLGYKEQAFYEAHPDIILALPDGNAIEGAVSNTDTGNEYTFAIFAVCLVDAFDEAEIARHYCLSFADDAAYADYVANLREQSLYPTSTEGLPEKVIALSTCANPGQGSDIRLLIYGGLFPQKDELPVE